MNSCCAECNTVLSVGHTRKYCSDACLKRNIDCYWQQPHVKKRWYVPVATPSVRPATATRSINENLLFIENCMMLGIELPHERIETDDGVN